MPVAAAGALVVAVAVLGALALRSPAPAAAPRSSAPLTGSPPLVLDLPAHPRGGEAALAAVSADIGAGRRGAGRDGAAARPRAARRGRHARAGRRRAAALPPGRGGHAIGVLRALVSDDDRAPVPALHLGLALLWSGQRAEATAELQETRSLDPDGLYGRTADNVLHPSYRKNYPLWVRSRFVHGSLAQLRARAAAAPRSLRGAARLRLRAPVQLAHARAPRGREGARARRRATSTRRWR